MTIEELEVGDLIWVEWGYGMLRAKYGGGGVFITTHLRLTGSLYDYYENGRKRSWLFRRKPLWKILKNFIFNK